MIAELEQPYRQVQMSLEPRNELFAALTNADLAFSPGGSAPPLGELCVSLGETQHAYAESFRTFKADFEYRYPDRTIVGDVERIRIWHGELDAQLDAALASLSDADAKRTVAREGEQVQLAEHLLVYQEALLIFYGKVFVYLKTRGLAMPRKWGAWIA